MSPATETETVPKEKKQTQEQDIPLYQVVLFDDDEHSYQYVMEMMAVLFGMSEQDAYQVAYNVDYLGQDVVKTCPLEEALIARDRILNYGPDPRTERSSGSMKATIQEAGE